MLPDAVEADKQASDQKRQQHKVRSLLNLICIRISKYTVLLSMQLDQRFEDIACYIMNLRAADRRVILNNLDVSHLLYDIITYLSVYIFC